MRAKDLPKPKALHTVELPKAHFSRDSYLGDDNMITLSPHSIREMHFIISHGFCGRTFTSVPPYEFEILLAMEDAESGSVLPVFDRMQPKKS